MKNKTIKILIIILITLIVVSLISIGVYELYKYNKFENEYTKFTSREVKSASVDLKKTEETLQNIDMEYVYQDDIGVRVANLDITKNKMNVEFDFKLNSNVDKSKFDFGFAICDEDKNIYGIHEPIGENSYWKKMYRELNIKYNKEDVFAHIYASSMGQKEKNLADDGSVEFVQELNSTKGFPDSKKLYIRVFNLNTANFENNNIDRKYISDSEWQFEVNL